MQRGFKVLEASAGMMETGVVERAKLKKQEKNAVFEGHLKVLIWIIEEKPFALHALENDPHELL